jgi:hypothetical protein
MQVAATDQNHTESYAAANATDALSNASNTLSNTGHKGNAAADACATCLVNYSHCAVVAIACNRRFHRFCDCWPVNFND